MAEETLEIVVKIRDEASKSVKEINLNIANLAKGAIGVGAVALAVKEMSEFLKESVKEAGDNEEAMRRLGETITRAGGNYKQSKASIDEYLMTLQQTTRYTEEEASDAVRQLMNYGMDYKQSLSAVTSAMDLASAKNIDLGTATKLLGRAYQGNTDFLKRYGIQATDFNGLMDVINKKFAGSAQNDLQGFNGQVANLSNYFKQLKETIGGALLPTLTTTINLMNQFFSWLFPNIDQKMSQSYDKIAKLRKEIISIQDSTDYKTNNYRKAQGDAKVMELAGQIDKELAIYQNFQTQKNAMEKFGKGSGTVYTPEKTNAMKHKYEEDYKNYLEFEKKKKEATASMTSETLALTGLAMDAEMVMIDQKAEKYAKFYMDEVDLQKWVTAQKLEAFNKEFNLRKNLDTAIDVLAIGSAEQQKYLIADILEAEMLAQSKKFAWIAVEKLLTLDFAGAAIAGAEALTLGYGSSVIHQETEHDKALRKAEQDERDRQAEEARKQLQDASSAKSSSDKDAYNSSYEAYVAQRKQGETRDQYEARYNMENGIASKGGGGSSGGSVSSIASAPAPTYYYINNSYNLNAGAVLGDEFNLDNAFKRLMERYDQSKLLTQAG